mmetsp:Transcript_47507/g.147076  ORF Transcript_47507/g.147076 Transcript_47507/m.147076 type:complete len:253 (-) Transcript_47507:486-1244(-)
MLGPQQGPGKLAPAGAGSAGGAAMRCPSGAAGACCPSGASGAPRRMAQPSMISEPRTVRPLPTGMPSTTGTASLASSLSPAACGRQLAHLPRRKRMPESARARSRRGQAAAGAVSPPQSVRSSAYATRSRSPSISACRIASSNATAKSPAAIGEPWRTPRNESRWAQPKGPSAQMRLPSPCHAATKYGRRKGARFLVASSTFSRKTLPKALAMSVLTTTRVAGSAIAARNSSNATCAPPGLPAPNWRRPTAS